LNNAKAAAAASTKKTYRIALAKAHMVIKERAAKHHATKESDPNARHFMHRAYEATKVKAFKEYMTKRNKLLKSLTKSEKEGAQKVNGKAKPGLKMEVPHHLFFCNKGHLS